MDCEVCTIMYDPNLIDPNSVIYLHQMQYEPMMLCLRSLVIVGSLMLGVIICLLVLYAKDSERIW